MWWRERRGVGRAEVPGELTSEGNRPKGDAPVALFETRKRKRKEQSELKRRREKKNRDT